MSSRTFPGTYSTITDKSAITTITSRFVVGLVGPASNGPINKAVNVQSLTDFQGAFGATVTGSYLAPAVQLVSPFSNAIWVVRVAREYLGLGVSGNLASGAAAAYTVSTANAPLIQVGDYIRVQQTGIASTVNALVVSKTTNSITLATPLAATYTAATISYSRVTPDQGEPALAANAANNAEAFLYGPTWAATYIGGGSVGSPISNTVIVSGTFGASQVTVVSDASNALFGSSPALAVGNTVIIEQAGLEASAELQISAIIPAVPGNPAVIQFQPDNNSNTGYQALSLQDTYTAATIRLVTALAGTTPVAQLHAANPGTYANSDGVSTGIIVNVLPGTSQNTKRLQVFFNSALVEDFDNLQFTQTIVNGQGATVANPNYISTRINGNSAYITYAPLALNNGTIPPPTNTYDGWSPTAPQINVAAFELGYNGENVLDADYIGTVDPTTDTATGLQIFNDTANNYNLAYLSCPGSISAAVAQEMAIIGHANNAQWVLDSPDYLTLAQVTAWSNGTGVAATGLTLDDYTGAIYFNWWQMTDSSTGKVIWVPPSLGALRAAAYTFQAFAPGWAAAGQNRGYLPEALAVRYPKINDAALQASYGNGQVINSILLKNGIIQVYGNNTTQRVNTEMSAVNNVTAVFFSVNGLDTLGQKYVFDPDDDILLTQIYQDFSGFLQGLVKQRVIADYGLVIDHTNNTPQTRAQRVVVVSYSVIPQDAAERIFINCTVNAAGATLVSSSVSN